MTNATNQRYIRPVMPREQSDMDNKRILSVKFLQDLTHEQSRLRALVEDLQTRLARATQAGCNCKELMSEVERLDGEKSSLLERNRSLSEMLSSAQQQTLNLEKEIAEVREENKRLNAELSELQNKTETNNTTTEEPPQPDFSGEQIREMKDIIDNLQRQLKHFHDHKCPPKTPLDSESLRFEVRRLKDENRVLKESNSNQLAELQSQINNKRQESELAVQLAELGAENKQLKHHLSSIAGELEAMRCKPDIVEKLKRKLAKSSEERVALTATVEKSRELSEEQAEQIAKLQGELSDLRKSFGAQRELNDELRREVETMRRRRSEQTDTKLFAEFVQLKRDLARVRDENERLKSGAVKQPLPTLKAESLANEHSRDSVSPKKKSAALPALKGL